MMLRPARLPALICAAILCVTASCTKQPPDDPRRPVVVAYADLVLATYEDTLTSARELDAAIDALIAQPSASTLDAARDQWRKARIYYSQSEAFRFYAGPIDGPGGPESQINAWPMDENHIDAVNPKTYIAAPGLNIIGDSRAFPQITPELIAAQNESGGEKNVASGYHAIEFLLWGQDLNDPPESAGQRPFTDFVSNGDATSVTGRRATYLKAASTLLIRDLDSVAAQWRVPAAGAENYRSKLVSGDVYTGLKRMITGMVTLAEVEMAGERMNVSLLSGDQEEEQSCFSDNSADELRHNALGIENVYLGRYKRLNGQVVTGPTLADLVKAADPRVADEMTERMRRVHETLAAIHDPYDREIQPDNVAGKARVQAGIDALRAEAQSFTRVAQALKIFLSPIESSGD